MKAWKHYRKRRLPELRRRPFDRERMNVRSPVPLSCAAGRQGLPKHWSPKSDADEIARIREELAIIAELGRHTIIW